jgi:hypothetical protein
MKKFNFLFFVIFICYLGTIIYLIYDSEKYRDKIVKLNLEIKEKTELIYRYENTVDAFDELTDTKCRETLDSIFGVYFYKK